jgi:glycosyltransferase involved in cell wall biosynthesis
MKETKAAEPTLAEAAALLADCRYLLVMPVPWYQAADESVWLDDLWYRDLVRHLDYISDLTVLAPRLPLESTEGMVQVPAGLRGLRFQSLPWGKSVLQGLVRAPATLVAAARAVRGADLVHSGVAGWPFAPGLFANPLAVLGRRPMVIVVESAFWRLAGSGHHSRKARLRAAVTESFARFSVRRAALSVFTHEGYRASLGQGSEARSIVTPATWIDENDVLSDDAARAAWGAKPGPVRVIVAARLTEGKGIAVLLAALATAEAEGVPLHVDVIGDGPLRAAVHEASQRFTTVQLRMLDPLPYGAPFLNMLRGYHAALVPSVTDEQPRILFDAASQALPILASDTEGHRMFVEEGVTGWRFAPDDATALLAVLRRAAACPVDLQAMGLTARERVLGQTHQAMHLVRARRLASLWRDRRGGVAEAR